LEWEALTSKDPIDLICHIRSALSEPFRYKNVPEAHQEGLRLFLALGDEERYLRIAKVLYPDGQIQECYTTQGYNVYWDEDGVHWDEDYPDDE
jgi:hypothetical protein